MTTAQARRIKADTKAKVQAETRVEELVTEAVKRTRRSKYSDLVYNFTAEDIIRERETKGLAWKRVAINLGLPNGSQARKAYRKLTGKAPSESNETTKRGSRLPAGTVLAPTHHPQWNDDSDQDEIIEKLDGALIKVQRKFRNITLPEEQLVVKRIVCFLFDGPDGDGPLCVTIIDRETEATRTFRITDIKEVM